MDNYNSLNLNKIRAALAENKKNQCDLMKLIGWSNRTASLKMNGKTQFKVNELSLIANYLEKPITYFFEK